MPYVKYGENRLHVVRGDVVWKCWRRRWTDGRRRTERRRMPAYTISSPVSLGLRSAKKLAKSLFCFPTWQHQEGHVDHQTPFILIALYRVISAVICVWALHCFDIKWTCFKQNSLKQWEHNRCNGTELDRHYEYPVVSPKDDRTFNCNPGYHRVCLPREIVNQIHWYMTGQGLTLS